MSTAHRPTWDPAQARDVKGGSRQFSVRDMAAHTKLKFRQPGQGSSSEVGKRDLKAELLAAEAEAKDRKRRALGLPSANTTEEVNGENEASKRRRLLQAAIEAEREEEEEEEEVKEKKDVKGKGKEREKETNGSSNGPLPASVADEEDEDEDAVNVDVDDEEEEEEEEDSDEDDEDETALLLRELEKIKRERAAEKERLDHESSEKKRVAREEEIATANPLLNLAAALGHESAATGTGVQGSFSVQRRWDDDRIFQNQALDQKNKQSGQFVNDLVRTEFHRKFMSRFIK